MKNYGFRTFENTMPVILHVIHRKAAPNWRILPEKTRHNNIVIILSGEMNIRCNGKEYKASKGDVIYYRPGDEREASVANSSASTAASSSSSQQASNLEFYSVNFHYTCVSYKDKEWYLEYPEMPFETVTRIEADALFKRLSLLFGNLYDTWFSAREDNVMRSRHIFNEILYLLLSYHYGSSLHYKKFDQVDKVIRFMDENYYRKITLEEMAEVAKMSPSYFGSVFKEVTGKPPVDYLLTMRINKAKELLLEGNSVSKTASLVGFSDIYYFSKCFKKYVGVSPKAYVSQQE